MAEPTEADRVKAINLLADTEVPRLAEYEDLIDSISEALRDARSSSTGWVPTSERMPEHNGSYLAYRADVGAFDAYSCGRIWRAGGEYGALIDGITHWQPLPKPPSDETGGGRG